MFYDHNISIVTDDTNAVTIEMH